MKITLFSLICLMFAATTAFAQSFTPSQCPYVGNTKSKIYHTAGQHSYAKMLRLNQKNDNRKCFKTAQEAQKAGYRAARR